MSGEKILKKVTVPKSKKADNAYWMCIIGPVKKSEIPYGGDYPLRQAVRDKFYEMFEPEDDVCASGWGINEERYQVLRSLHCIDTDSLKKLLKIHKEL